MVHHLASFGWPYLLLAALALLAAGPSFGTLVARWARFEWRLWRYSRARGGYITDTSTRARW